MWGISFWPPLVALSCPSVHVEQLDSHWTDFGDFVYCGVGVGMFTKVARKNSNSAKSGQ
jgi:hypothetical protein